MALPLICLSVVVVRNVMLRWGGSDWRGVFCSGVLEVWVHCFDWGVLGGSNAVTTRLQLIGNLGLAA